jgi:gas vesicle protein
MRSSDEYGAMNGNSGGGGSSFMMGMLCGAAVGAALGLLLAPKPGAALRSDLRKSADDLSRRARKMYDGASGTISDLADQGVKAFDQVAETAGRLADRGRSQASRPEA